jgi:hypothetical protein
MHLGSNAHYGADSKQEKDWVTPNAVALYAVHFKAIHHRDREGLPYFRLLYAENLNLILTISSHYAHHAR